MPGYAPIMRRSLLLVLVRLRLADETRLVAQRTFESGFLVVAGKYVQLRPRGD